MKHSQVENKRNSDRKRKLENDINDLETFSENAKKQKETDSAFLKKNDKKRVKEKDGQEDAETCQPKFNINQGEQEEGIYRTRSQKKSRKYIRGSDVALGAGGFARPPLAKPLGVEDLRYSSRRSGPEHEDDPRTGHFEYRIGENFTPRSSARGWIREYQNHVACMAWKKGYWYLTATPIPTRSDRINVKIMRRFGEGTFGRVLECWDRRRKTYVAIKVVRNVEKYRAAAMTEMEIITTLHHYDRNDEYQVIRLLDWFDYRGHICMVFPRLGDTLYDCMKRNRHKMFHIDVVKNFVEQILNTVAYVHSLEMVHTDLKPENILFPTHEYVRIETSSKSLAKEIPKYQQLTLIDFGSAVFNSEKHAQVVSTRHYRAPEIILGLPWSIPCDIWSIGCIFMELLIGHTLFQTHDDLEHLAMIEALLGPMPAGLRSRALATKQGTSFIRANGTIKFPGAATSMQSIRAVERIRGLSQSLTRQTNPSISAKVARLLVDLIRKMMAWDPEDRYTAEEALLHQLFQ